MLPQIVNSCASILIPPFEKSGSLTAKRCIIERTVLSLVSDVNFACASTLAAVARSCRHTAVSTWNDPKSYFHNNPNRGLWLLFTHHGKPLQQSRAWSRRLNVPITIARRSWIVAHQISFDSCRRCYLAVAGLLDVDRCPFRVWLSRRCYSASVHTVIPTRSLGALLRPIRCLENANHSCPFSVEHQIRYRYCGLQNVQDEPDVHQDRSKYLCNCSESIATNGPRHHDLHK
jgi:hypothetical protein